MVWFRTVRPDSASSRRFCTMARQRLPSLPTDWVSPPRRSVVISPPSPRTGSSSPGNSESSGLGGEDVRPGCSASPIPVAPTTTRPMTRLPSLPCDNSPRPVVPTPSTPSPRLGWTTSRPGTGRCASRTRAEIPSRHWQRPCPPMATPPPRFRLPLASRSASTTARWPRWPRPSHRCVRPRPGCSPNFWDRECNGLPPLRTAMGCAPHTSPSTSISFAGEIRCPRSPQTANFDELGIYATMAA